MPKLAISDIAWNLSEEDEVFKLMKGLDIKNLEISPFKLRSSLPESNEVLTEKIINKLNYYGINVVAVQSLLYRHPELNIFESEQTREKTLIHLLSVIDFSSKIGAKVLIFGSPKNKIKGSLSNFQALKIAVDFFSIIGEKTKSLGLKFCLEPTPATYGADFIRNTKEAVDLLKRINSDGLGIIDIGSLIINKNSIKDNVFKVFIGFSKMIFHEKLFPHGQREAEA